MQPGRRVRSVSYKGIDITVITNSSTTDIEDSSISSSKC